MISDTHPSDSVATLRGKFLTNTSLLCWNHVEWAYNSKSGTAFPKICCWCGEAVSISELEAYTEKRKQFTSCLPLCSKQSCTQKGWRTRGKKRAQESKKEAKTAKKAKIEKQKSILNENRRRKNVFEMVVEGKPNKRKKSAKK